MWSLFEPQSLCTESCSSLPVPLTLLHWRFSFTTCEQKSVQKTKLIVFLHILLPVQILISMPLMHLSATLQVVFPQNKCQLDYFSAPLVLCICGWKSASSNIQPGDCIHCSKKLLLNWQLSEPFCPWRCCWCGACSHRDWSCICLLGLQLQPAACFKL